jgi:predicted ATPase/DNA-binding SARP family transcriptional activator
VPSIDFRILGDLEVAVEDASVPLGGLRQRAVLAVLILRRTMTMPAELIAEELWPDEQPLTAVKMVQVYISRLRHLLGTEATRLRSVAGGYRLRIADDELDAMRLEFLVGRGLQLAHDGDHRGAVARFDDALRQWRGPALADFAYESFAQPEAARLAEIRLEAQEGRFASLLELGQDARLVPDVRALLTEHPYREQLWATLVRALYLAGRQAEALEAIRHVRDSLRDELGIDIGPDLQAIELAVLNQDDLLGRRTQRRPILQVPAQLTGLIGRDQELDDLEALLEAHRLVTITGPGGTGKTRLAIEVATRIGPARFEATVFVDLSSIREQAFVAPAIAAAMSVVAAPGRSVDDALRTELGLRQVLIILDNFEQIISAAPFVGRLLSTAPGLRIIITSRSPLHLRGEWDFPLAPLPVAGPDEPFSLIQESPAVQLFVERAAAAGPTISLTKENARTIARICERVEGLPLAVELAAVRTRVMTPDDLLRHLERRLTFLNSGPGDVPARQQTIRATIEWSHDLLSQPEAALFRSISVFVGGFTMESAEAVCAGLVPSIVDSLGGLVDQALIRRFEMEDEGETRFAMLETVREYASERLEPSPDRNRVERRHAEYFLALAERARPELKGPMQHAWLLRLDADLDNFRAALAWAIRDDAAELGLRLAASLRPHLEMRGRVTEAREWLDQLLESRAPRSDAVEALALNAAGALAYLQGDYDRAEETFQASLDLRRQLGDVAAVAGSLSNLASVADERGDHARALKLMGQCVAAWREIGDSWGLAVGLANMASHTASHLLDYATASELLREAIGLFRQLGDETSLSWTLTDLGAVALYRGDTDQAATLLDEGLVLAREIGAAHEIANALQNLGQLATRGHDHKRARALLAESMQLFEQNAELVGVAQCLEKAGELFQEEGEWRDAARVWGCAAALRRSIDARMYAADQVWFDRSLELVRLKMTDEEFDVAWTEGEAADHRAFRLQSRDAAPFAT